VARPKVDRKPLIAYLETQRVTDREIIDIFRGTLTRVEAELHRLERKSGIGAKVRSEQLRRVREVIHREMAATWARVGSTVEAGRAEAAAAAIKSAYPPGLLGAIFPKKDREYMLRSAEATARRHSQTLAARLGLSKIPLAQSVYHNKELASGKIDAIVNEALARGASAKELADDVIKYINPNVPGGTSYAALRLGRTELNNAFHAQQVQSGIETPWTTGLRWNLSGSHPRPDECNEYADTVHEEGKPAGVYTPENVPAKPHPNCLCFTTPEVVGRDELIKQFEAGAYDDYLDSSGVSPSEG